MIGKTISELYVGETAESVHLVTEADSADFGRVTGDYNPIHFDEEFAAKTRFKGKIAHGMILAGYLSGVIGTQLPGVGTLYAEQSLKFLRPVKFGETVTARVEVLSIQQEKNRVRLKTECFNQAGECVLTGEALVLPRKE